MFVIRKRSFTIILLIFIEEVGFSMMVLANLDNFQLI